MKNKHSSIDGFIPRRSGNQMGELHGDDFQKAFIDMPENRLLHTTGGDEVRVLGQPQLNRGLGRSDIEESLSGIDSIKEPIKKLSFRQRRLISRRAQKPRSMVRLIVKWFIIILLMAILAFGGYTAYKFITAGNNIFQGNIFDIFSNQPLKRDSNGRSNFLILGTSEDDPGHPGSNLTDSILVLSVDQKDKNVYMFSVPRDLEVQYGDGCSNGSVGKINAYFSCINDGTTKEDEQDRLTRTQKFIGDIFGIDIQYGIHVNQTVIREAVDAVDGIDVDVQGSGGAPGILDRNFDWRCNYACYLVKYDNGIHHLDGDSALYLSMARGDKNGLPTDGLGNSNFDREKNQQKILIALKDKAMSTGTLTNLGAVTKLIDSLGDNLRTNIQTNEIRTLMEVVNETKSSDVHTLSLIDGDNPVMKGDGNPSAGLYNYSDIQVFIKKNLSSDPIVREAAPIVVLDGTEEVGFGQTKADILIAAGYNVMPVDNAPSGTYDEVEIYQIGDGNTGTADKLSTLYNVAIKKTTPPITVANDVRFVIIFGDTSS